MNKALMNASVASMIYKFNMENIEILQDMGYQVDVACNFGKENPISEEEIADFRKILKRKHIRVMNTKCPRNIFSIKNMVRTYQQLKRIADREHYDLVHTQSPIGGVICRLAFRNARKNGTRVIYTAHGFHFFKGAPIQNWLIYYPIEKFCSRFNDVLITINKEDYDLAKKHFHTKTVEKIPGVGVDISRFKGCNITKAEKRKELGISENAFVLLSVGELSSRKNHQVVIKALGEIADSSIYYVIAGKGEDYENYKRLADDAGIGNRLILLGARTDVDELCVAADVFVHPSVREGLGIAPLEGMAAGLPLISSYVNGIKDYTEDGVSGVCVKNPVDVDEMKKAILRMHDDADLRKNATENNIKTVEKFSLAASKNVMNEIYEKIRGGGYSHLLRILKRAEIGAKDDDLVLMSVGEVNENKNHRAIIEAMHILKDEEIKYFIVGQGALRGDLQELTEKYNLENQVFFMGYREDIPQLLNAVDVFCFPSKREGLGLAAVEAMASGLPLITSNVHGINDYSVNGVTGYKCAPDDYRGFAQMIENIKNDNEGRSVFGKRNAVNAERYDVKEAERRMREIYYKLEKQYNI